MKLLTLCPHWGSTDLPLEDFFIKIKESGYDGIDTWMPEDVNERKKLIGLLDEYQLVIVSHQHQAKGNTIEEFCKSLEYYLSVSMECNPLLINSHSGKDYFSLDDQLKVIDTVEEFSIKNNIIIAHETHRGNIGYSPYNAMDLFKQRPKMKITADFSHWVCVTESWLENSTAILKEAIKRTRHVHARVGYPEGPQIPDPRLEAWSEPVKFFMGVWKSIFDYQKSINAKFLTITTEFGPPPYMWTNLEDNSAITSQWEVNCYMKDLLRENLI